MMNCDHGLCQIYRNNVGDKFEIRLDIRYKVNLQDDPATCQWIHCLIRIGELLKFDSKYCPACIYHVIIGYVFMTKPHVSVNT